MFSRGSRSTGRHARDDRASREQSRGRLPADPPEPAGIPEQPGVPFGPFDISAAPPDVARVDLGSLKIPAVSGVEVRVQANQEGVVHQVYLVHGESALQLGVFAAPRTESIWDEVREEIRRSLFADGVATEEVGGDYGTELRARLRTPQGLKDLRFVGVSGPRWLARAVFQGPAALDPASAGPLVECLRGVVVDRGPEAKPVKEPLPLTLPESMAGQLRPGAGGGPAATAPAAPGGSGPDPSRAAPVNGSALAGATVPDQPPARRQPSPRPRREE